MQEVYLCCAVANRYQHFFSVNDQRVNILGFADHPVATSQPRSSAEVYIMQMNMSRFL